METAPVVTAASAAAEAAASVAPETTTTTTTAPPAVESPKIAKATDIFADIEADIKKMTAAERAATQPRQGGKFAKAEGSETEAQPEGVEPVDSEPAAESSEAAPEVPPEGTPEPEAPKEPRKLAAEFTVSDEAGELEIPDIKLSFKANGKEHKDVPLDRVVKLAQWGAYNEQREQEVREVREKFPQYEQAIQAKDQQLSAYVEAYRELLSDENAYIQARNEYQAINTPEAQLQRLQDERKQEQVTRSQQENEFRVQAQAQQFASYLAPKLEALVAQNPTVSFDEVFGRYNLLTAPLLQGGRIPPDRFQAVDHLVETELAGYIASLHSDRSKASKQAVAATAAAKRQLARTVAPRGTTPSAPLAAKPKSQQSYTKATDILGDIGNIVRESVA